VQIRVEQPFSLYADIDVTYNGRASSTLERGKYLIIHKSDGTLLIMGGSLYKPRNYQSPGAVLKINGNQLTSSRKDECISITVHQIISYVEYPEWSISRTKITKTERELRDRIAKFIRDFIPTAAEVFIEFQTPVGNIDILVIDNDGLYNVIEVKRGKANLAACSQTNRYSDYFKSLGYCTKNYIASPSISQNALNYAEERGIIWLKVDHAVSEDDVV